MRQIKNMILVAALLPMYCFAQQENTPPSFKHRFEILGNAGEGLSGSIKMPADPMVRDWKGKTSIAGTLAASYYITKRINAGIKFNLYKWHTSVSFFVPGTAKQVIDGYNRGYSVGVFGDYHIPIGQSMIYGGLAGGRATVWTRKSEEGLLIGGERELF